MTKTALIKVSQAKKLAGEFWVGQRRGVSIKSTKQEKAVNVFIAKGDNSALGSRYMLQFCIKYYSSSV